MKKIKSVQDLLSLYNEAETIDKEFMAECRSNALLVAGEHYAKKGSRFWSRVRDSKELDTEQKIRITQNHIQRITKAYLNHLVSSSPGVKIIPRNERETQDQKAAELHNAVWAYGADQMKFPSKLMNLAKDFVDLGESFVKIYWDDKAGKVIGYEGTMNEMGELQVDEMGMAVPDKTKPVFQGELKIEQVYPHNVLRDVNCQTIDESPFIMIRKLVDMDVAKEMLGDDEEKQKLLQAASKEEYMIFSTNQGYMKSQNQVLWRETFIRPCPSYPNGYFYVFTDAGILFEGELPYGIFPIVYAGFDSLQTSPRHRSIIKQLRPYQLEINRAASRMAENSIVHGDDKVWVQSGTKVAQGAQLPGIRVNQYSGAQPVVTAGRVGEQWVSYIDSKIKEMYQVANLDELVLEKDVQADPFAMLFRSAKEKKKFTIYAEKFERYLKEICEVYLSLAKQYFDEQMVIPMIGRNEIVNIPEFKSIDPLCYSVKVMPQSDDINTMMGKMLTVNHILQYNSSQLSKDDIGKLIRLTPYVNTEEGFSDLTLNYDYATNFILALERGSKPFISQYADPVYMIKRLDKRMLESDFQFLSPQIQQTFMQARQFFADNDIKQKQEIQRAQAGFIPSGGALVKADLQVTVPNSEGGTKTTRAVFPVEALSWLQKQLDIQGSAQDQLQRELTPPGMAEYASQFNQTPMPQDSGMGPIMPKQGPGGF